MNCRCSSDRTSDRATRSNRSMRLCGNAYGSPAMSTTTARMTDSVIGSCRWNDVPTPGVVLMRTVPPTARAVS